MENCITAFSCQRVTNSVMSLGSELSGHFGTTADVSFGHIGISAEMLVSLKADRTIAQRPHSLDHYVHYNYNCQVLISSCDNSLPRNYETMTAQPDCTNSAIMLNAYYAVSCC